VNFIETLSSGDDFEKNYYRVHLLSFII